MVMRSIIKSRSLIFLGDKISTTRFLNIVVEEIASLKYFTVTFTVTLTVTFFAVIILGLRRKISTTQFFDVVVEEM